MYLLETFYYTVPYKNIVHHFNPLTAVAAYIRVFIFY